MNLKKGSFFLLISTSWFIFMKIGIRKRIYWVYSVNWSCICSQMLWKIESECFQWDSFAWKRLTLKRSSLKYTTKLGIYWPVELKKNSPEIQLEQELKDIIMVPFLPHISALHISLWASFSGRLFHFSGKMFFLTTPSLCHSRFISYWF